MPTYTALVQIGSPNHDHAIAAARAMQVRIHGLSFNGAVVSVEFTDPEPGRTGVHLSRDQLEAWAGRTLSGDELSRLGEAIEYSSIPEAVEVIANEALAPPAEDDPEE